MSTLNPPKKISKRHELREDKVITFYARAWDFFDKNRTLVYGIIAGIVVLALAAVGFAIYRSGQGVDAEQQLAAILPVYETGDYQAALDGQDGLPGLLEIADEYGGTEAGNLAHFYAADALYRVGRFEEALDHFDDFDASSEFLEASALAGEAAVYENQNAFERAGDLYREAALAHENELTSPQYLLNAGRAYEAAGEYDAARSAYETIRERFPESTLVSGLDFYLARVDAKQRAAQAKG